MRVDLTTAEIAYDIDGHDRRLRRLRRALHYALSRDDPSGLAADTLTREMRLVVSLIAKLEHAMGRSSRLDSRHPLTCRHGRGIDERCEICDEPARDDD